MILTGPAQLVCLKASVCKRVCVSSLCVSKPPHVKVSMRKASVCKSICV